MSLVSIILPFRNAESTLEAAIGSVLHQSLVDFELILIDDHSEDNSLEIAQSIEDTRIRIVRNPNKGLVKALNFGLDLAQGTYIARMDADDISHPHRLEQQLQLLQQRTDRYAISCQVQHISTNDPLFDDRGYQYYVNWTNTLITPDDHYCNRFADAPIAHPTLFCHKSLFEQFGRYALGGHPEDFELWLRWMAQGVKFEKVNAALYYWTDYPHRLSRTHPDYADENFYKVKAAYLAKCSVVKNKQIWIIGYGKEVFNKSGFLAQYNLKITGYVDVKHRPDSSRSVIGYGEIVKSKDKFYLIYVSHRQGKQLIAKFMKEKSMLPGLDYYLMA